MHSFIFFKNIYQKICEQKTDVSESELLSNAFAVSFHFNFQFSFPQIANTCMCLLNSNEIHFQAVGRVMVANLDKGKLSDFIQSSTPVLKVMFFFFASFNSPRQPGQKNIPFVLCFLSELFFIVKSLF
jgi:hypothetical protein